MIAAIAILSLLLGGYEYASYPLCKSRQDIEEHHGSFVSLIGTYKYTSVRKGRHLLGIAQVVLADDTAVILRYGPSQDEVARFDGRKVLAIGRSLG